MTIKKLYMNMFKNKKKKDIGALKERCEKY